MHMVIQLFYLILLKYKNLNKTTKSHPLSENIIDNKTINQTQDKNFPPVKQINDTDTVIEVFPITFEESLTKDDSDTSESNVSSLDQNNTLKVGNNTEFLQSPPPTISYIENEGVQVKPMTPVSKDGDRNTSDEEEDDESSRNTSDEEEDDESSRNTSDEEEDDESSRNTSDEEEDDESSRNTSDEEEDDESSRNTSDEEEDDESSRNTSDEEEDDESSRNTSDEEEDDESSRNTSDEEEDDESSRNTSDEEEDDESSRNTSDEEEDDESSRNTSDEEEDDESSRNTSDEEEDDESSRNTSDEEEDDESSRNTSDEEEDDESSRNTNEPIIRELYYKKSNLVSTNELIGNKTIGNSIDNENDKLISQISELNSSVMPNLQMQADDPNSKSKDRKPIVNAGLDQVITSDQNIVLDASS